MAQNMCNASSASLSIKLICLSKFVMIKELMFVEHVPESLGLRLCVFRPESLSFCIQYYQFS